MQIRIATHDDQRMVVIQEAVKLFRIEHPEVSVLLELLPNKMELLKQIANGTGPDIVEWEGANIGQCLDAGMLTDLSEFIARDKIDLEDFYPCIRDATKDHDRVGAMPVMAETIGVFYNKQHFDEAGLPYPQEGWTWDEFVATAAKLTQRDFQGNVLRHGVFVSYGYMIYIEPVVWNNGGSFLAEDGKTLEGYLDSPATIEAFQHYMALIDSGISPRLGVGRDSWMDCFVYGKMSMYLDANWAIKPMSPEVKARFGVVGFPGNKLQTKENLFQLYGYGISGTSTNRELAWSLLSKIAIPGNGIEKLWSVLNLSVSKTAATLSGQAIDPLYATFLEELKYGRNGAYQWLNFLDAFHCNHTFNTLVHESDVERELQAAVRRTPVLAQIDYKSAPNW